MSVRVLQPVKAALRDVHGRDEPLRHPTALRYQLDHVVHRSTVPSSELVDQLAFGFVEAFATQHDVLRDLSVKEARQLGLEAARSLLATLRWNQAIGDRLSTREVTELLHVSRQALAKRVQSGGLLALPGSRTTWYPSWQFDRAHRDVRRCVREILAEFRRALGDDFDPLTIATWMNSPNSELDDMSPGEWVAKDAPSAPVIDLAREFAARLGQ